MKDRLLGSFPARVVKRYGAASGGTWTVAIAWNLLFAFFPIVLAITTVLGLVAGGSLSTSIDSGIAGAIPGQQGQLIVQALDSFHKAAGPLFVVSFVGLLWSGSSLFSAMDQGLDSLYPTKQRSFVRQKLMAVAMIALFTVLVVPAVSTATLLSVISKISAIPSFISTGPVALLLQIVFGVIDGALLFGAIYLVVPNRPHRVREILPGAITAAALFELFMLVFPLYFKLQHGFSTYGQTFAIFFLLMTLAYWIAQIVMLGGAVNAELHPPDPNAFPRAGSSIDPNAQTDADRNAEVRGERAPQSASRSDGASAQREPVGAGQAPNGRAE